MIPLESAKRTIAPRNIWLPNESNFLPMKFPDKREARNTLYEAVLQQRVERMSSLLTPATPMAISTGNAFPNIEAADDAFLLLRPTARVSGNFMIRHRYTQSLPKTSPKYFIEPITAGERQGTP